MSKSSGRLSLSVVTCTYSASRTTQLLRLIEALRAQAVTADELIVVVDHNDALLASVRSSLPDVTVVANRHERGLSGGRNTGLDLARGDIVAFIDDDAVPAPGWLDGIAAGYDDPAIMGVGGPVEPAWDGEAPRWFPAEFGWVVGCGYVGLPSASASVRNLIGCNMSFRRAILEPGDTFRIELGRVGLAPVGCEETEFCIRLSRRRPGGVLRYDPQARVRHDVPKNRMTWSYFRSRCYFEGMSKARVARLVGADIALSSERAYVARTLTAGVKRNVFESLRGDAWGFARATAILTGLAATTLGYIACRVQLAFAPSAAAAPPAEAVRQT